MKRFPSILLYLPFFLFGLLVMIFGLRDLSAHVSSEADKMVWISSRLELVIGIMIFLVPILFWARMRMMYDFSEAMKEVSRQMTDVEVIRKEYFKVRTSLEELHRTIAREVEQAEALGQVVGRLEGLQQSLNNEMFLRQQVGNMDRLLQSWQQCVIEHFRSIERALANDISDTSHEIYEKSVSDLLKILQRVGLDLIRPVAGDQFDEFLHIHGGEETSGDIPEGTILRCKNWGYRSGKEIIKRAEVICAIPLPQPEVVVPNIPSLENLVVRGAFNDELAMQNGEDVSEGTGLDSNRKAVTEETTTAEAEANGDERASLPNV